MKRVLLLLAIAACTKASSENVKASDPAPGARTINAPAPGDPSAAVATDLAWKTVDGPAALAAFAKDAAAAHLKPYAYLHASWCGPCKAIEKTHADDPKMVAAFKGTAIALMDIDAVDKQALDAAGLESSAIPVFFKLDASGKPTGEKIDGGAWGDNVPDNMAPPLAAFFAR
jgi:thiol-disulfide isomerase/thioredoxin